MNIQPSTFNAEQSLAAVRARSETATTKPLGRQVRGLFPPLVPVPPLDYFDEASEAANILQLAPRLVANARMRGQCRDVTPEEVFNTARIISTLPNYAGLRSKWSPAIREFVTTRAGAEFNTYEILGWLKKEHGYPESNSASNVVNLLKLCSAIRKVRVGSKGNPTLWQEVRS